MIGLVILIVALLFSMIKFRKSDYTALSNRMARRERNRLQLMRPCPLCTTMLQRGERVHTVVFSGGEPKKDRASPAESLVHMFGCPYCYPANADHPRRCPVCNELLADDAFVIARMFEKGARKHVHVLGCTHCRSRSKW